MKGIKIYISQFSFSALWKCAFCLFFVCMGHLVSAQTAVAREYQVKAVFLYNFTQFVQWHPSSFVNSGTPLVIGVLGNDPFGSYLDQTVAGEKVAGRSITVKRFSEVNDVSTCHILFISTSQATIETLTNLKRRNILTVGEGNNFVKQGGVIRFYTESNKIRLQINLAAAKEAGLEISSKLLRVANVVE